MLFGCNQIQNLHIPAQTSLGVSLVLNFVPVLPKNTTTPPCLTLMRIEVMMAMALKSVNLA